MFLSTCLQWKLYFTILNRPLKINANKYNYKIKKIKICLNKSNTVEAAYYDHFGARAFW